MNRPSEKLSTTLLAYAPGTLAELPAWWSSLTDDQFWTVYAASVLDAITRGPIETPRLIDCLVYARERHRGTIEPDAPTPPRTTDEQRKRKLSDSMRRIWAARRASGTAPRQRKQGGDEA